MSEFGGSGPGDAVIGQSNDTVSGLSKWTQKLKQHTVGEDQRTEDHNTIDVDTFDIATKVRWGDKQIAFS